MDGFIMETPLLKLDDLGGKTPLFSENTQKVDDGIFLWKKNLMAKKGAEKEKCADGGCLPCLRKIEAAL